MLSIVQYFLLLSTISILFFTSTSVWSHLDRKRKAKAKGCAEVYKYPHKDPILGLDFVKAMKTAFNEHRWLRWQQDLFQRLGKKTFEVKFAGSRMIWTSESENMKAISTSHWRLFGVQELRRGSGAADPIAGPGVNSADGHIWDFSRNLTKPYFTRDGYSNLGRLEVHTDRLLSLISTDQSTFDILPLLQRWFLDTSTEFLFGESVNSLENQEKTVIIPAMSELLRGLRARLQMSKFVFIHRDKHWFESVNLIRNFLSTRIDETLKQLQEQRLAEKVGSGKIVENERTDLLWDIAQQVQDKEVLLDQIMAVFIPSSDTTSVLISNALFALARHPDIYAKLRKEVLDYEDQPLTFERLRGMKYLNYIVHETHRVYPNAIQMVRLALEDTTLPVGGGSTETEPIFISKGDIVAANRYMMHRDPDIWGSNAEEFVPERWVDARPMWRYVPFGGGPRICPAHTMVNTEAAYVLLRIVRDFKALEARDDRPWTPVMRVGPSSLHGVRIGLVPA